MKKKLISLLAVVALTVGTLAGCGGSGESAPAANDKENEAASESAAGDDQAADDTAAASNVKAGFIFLHDENSTYDLNFLNGAK